MDTRQSKTSNFGSNHRETASGELGGVRLTGKKVTKGTTMNRLPTYRNVRAGRFTNALLAMLVITLFCKYLRMKTD